MARKVSISKEIILESALNMLIRDGYSSINVKTLASEIGCSTQPIVWHFNNMEGFRKALSVYALEYANSKNKSIGDAAKDFENMGSNYVKMAVNEPNLFKFLYLGESSYELKDSFKDKNNKTMATEIAHKFGISEQQALNCIRNIIFYSHGLATMVATGVIKMSQKKMMEMIKQASEAFLIREKGYMNE
ncbi:MAG: TetR/AcrR family transcriptional regulator [Lachnospiraceae bacterium]|nr:TetR/AcrR family transcriptional regulator [Lachnospiraceae bacterium]